jgi:2-keto-4-pentenoate hydratase/2-oxohepta-3-ene-1,7-dioic acid hydratase in catechol pathway
MISKINNKYYTFADFKQSQLKMKIICIGRNYVDHAKELNNPIPKSPLIFMKPATALLTDSNPFYHPAFSQNIHYELEVVLKISKNGKAIQEHFPETYYQQIGLGIDFTARDLQDDLKDKGQPWELAKAFDQSACIGDFVDKSSLDINNVKFKLTKNGHIVQDGNTSDLIFNFNYLISYISQYFTLQVGDLIFTGTPAGVGKVEIGDSFDGFMEGKQLIKCTIK